MSCADRRRISCARASTSCARSTPECELSDVVLLHGRKAAVVSHGIIRQQAEVPAKDIERAVQRKVLFVAKPQRHTVVPPED